MKLLIKMFLDVGKVEEIVGMEYYRKYERMVHLSESIKML